MHLGLYLGLYIGLYIYKGLCLAIPYPGPYENTGLCLGSPVSRFPYIFIPHKPGLWTILIIKAYYPWVSNYYTVFF
jgi:hypothetical protein